MKKYYIITIGCQMNKSDSERVASYLEDLGMDLTEKDKEADLVVINTCGVRQTAEDRIYGLIGRLKKQNKQVKIILTGCLSERKDVYQKVADKVDIWMGIDELVSLREKLEVLKTPKSPKTPKTPQPPLSGGLSSPSACPDPAFAGRRNKGDLGGFKGSLKSINPSSRRERSSDYLKINPKYQSKISAFVPIGNGCDNFCAYCIVPFARGKEVYRSFGEILKEIECLLSDGYKEINLIAQNVNSYVCPQTKKDFSDLLLAVNNLEGYFWLRFSTSHPKDMSRKLIKTMPKCEKLCEHLHLPAQAGSDKIIKAMNRRYKIADFKKLINDYLKEYKKRDGNKIWQPTPGLSTDIIVGFPGESKKDFEQTVKLFKELKFDMAFISQYSPRPNTPAFGMKDDVEKQEKKEREEKLTDILRKTSLANNKKYIGNVVEVLVESESKKGELIGRTRTNKAVKFKKSQTPQTPQPPLFLRPANAGSGQASGFIGKFVNVKITKVENFSMAGELVSPKKAVVIVGTTASGKTNLAVNLAYKFNGEVISADSRQVYKGMDIGTGKDLDEYFIKGAKVEIKHHLIDVVSPKTKFSLADFKKKADKALVDIWDRGKLPIIAGGTGLYAQSLVDNFNLDNIKPDKKLRVELEKLNANELFIKLKKENKNLAESLNESERKNKRRLIRKLEVEIKSSKPPKSPLSGGLFSPPDKGGWGVLRDFNNSKEFLIIGLTWSKELLEKNIYKRIVDRLENEDMVGEVERLHKEGVSWKRLEDFGLEYKFIALYLQGKLKYDEMVEQLFIATRQFAKRQITWLKRWERQGAKINWFCEDDLSKFEDIKREVEGMVEEFLG